MNKRIGFGISLMAVVLLAGCAGNSNAMQAKVDALEAKTHEQEKQIADLKKQEEPTTQALEEKAKGAWDWTVSHSEAAWNSDTAVDARARLKACYEDLKKNSGK